MRSPQAPVASPAGPAPAMPPARPLPPPHTVDHLPARTRAHTEELLHVRTPAPVGQRRCRARDKCATACALVMLGRCSAACPCFSVTYASLQPSPHAHLQPSHQWCRNPALCSSCEDTFERAETSHRGNHCQFAQVLKALEAIIDPDFGMNIVECGFVKDLAVDASEGAVAFRLELTTPACPIKDQFERDANAAVAALPWVQQVRLRSA